MSNVEPTYWADVMESLLSVTCQALADTPLGTPANCYVSHNRPADDCCDYLAVWVEHFIPTVKFPNEWTDYDNCNIVRMMAAVCVTLRRPCWPTVVDNASHPFPDPAVIDSASTNLLIDSQAVWRAMTQAYDAGALFFTPRPCDYVRWGRFTPMVNTGGCAGWDFRLTIDLDECS